MASTINLEELPQLVMEKITSFLNHKELQVLEQASRKLKDAVDDHFSMTDHLIIGRLPEIKRNDKMTANDKKCLDGLLQIMKRCGIRLQTIQIPSTYQFPSGTTSIVNYSMYCKHFFASAEVSSNCPNIENIIASPNVDIITMIDHDMFRQQKVLLLEDNAKIYANNIKLSTGGTCKLRSINLSSRRIIEDVEHSYKRILDLFSNLEQISVCYPDENFYNFLPQLMESGLQDLSIIGMVDLRIAKKYCNIWKDLRTLRFHLTVRNVDDITVLNKLQLPENVELRIEICNVGDCFARLNENVCNAIVNCEVWGPTDYRLLSKLKNLQQFTITNSDQLQVIADGSFLKLRRIHNTYLCDVNNCALANTYHSQKVLPQLLINKGNQLTHIRILHVCNKLIPLVWKALKHCKAAKSILLYLVEVEWPITAIDEDMAAICELPNLERLSFSIRDRKDDYGLLGTQIRPLLERAVKEHTDFQFKHKLLTISYYDDEFSLYRINH